jgi:hypothetical protein
MHGAGTMDGVLIAALVLLCQICWAGALNAGLGRALSLLRLMAGQRLDACDPVGGGLGAFVTIYYNILSFNDKPIGLYRIMLLIFYRYGYGAIRTRPPPKKKSEREQKNETTGTRTAPNT